jgi:hypothetical protein
LDTDALWHHGHTLAAGQMAEFKVWAELVRQSMGGLHVFLPLRDMGIDGVVHRLIDGAYIAVQVKGRTELTSTGQVHLTVTASSLRDDEALVVGVLVEEEQLGRMVLVVPESTFRELASHDVVDGREYLTAAFELHGGGKSRWAPFLVEREGLAERFGAAAALIRERDESELLGVDRGREGFLGEMEVIRRLAEPEALNLFRPFPDLETVEVLARHVVSGRFLGLRSRRPGGIRSMQRSACTCGAPALIRSPPPMYACSCGIVLPPGSGMTAFSSRARTWSRSCESKASGSCSRCSPAALITGVWTSTGPSWLCWDGRWRFCSPLSDKDW